MNELQLVSRRIRRLAKSARRGLAPLVATMQAASVSVDAWIEEVRDVDDEPRLHIDTDPFKHACRRASLLASTVGEQLAAVADALEECGNLAADIDRQIYDAASGPGALGALDRGVEELN